ncbi:uncharacterized protein LOC131949014 [Physella acuta]|uniref:uncharacterized protein LOC131949014 n=1 Tax=Physella acuta TaxID=109671 RepID=UPI0027DB9C42|nr:uncharacterized protein LOC131949014 [Physella acuta]XP_059166751.1 uncharacterized protein LOC131949014 [Physella acuta]
MDNIFERTIQDVEMLMHQMNVDLQGEYENDGYDDMEEDDGDEANNPAPGDAEVNTDTLDQNLETLLAATRALITSMDQRLTALENSMNSTTTAQPSLNRTDGNLQATETAVNTQTLPRTTRVYSQYNTQRIQYVHVARHSFPFDLLTAVSIGSGITYLFLMCVLFIFFLDASNF